MAAGDQLPPTRLLAYGALGLPLAALNLPLYVYLPPFYAAELGLGFAAVGAALFAARLLDVLTDPLIGELSDRTSTPLGRRRPWLLGACPLLILATFMLFDPDEGVGVIALFVWTNLAYVAWTAMILPYTALGAELSPDYHERARIAGVREGFVLVGILLAAALPAMLGAEAGSGRVLETLAVAMAVLLPLTLLVLLLLVNEPGHRPESGLRFVDGLKIAARNRPFVRLVSAYLLNGIANGLPATLFLLFVGHVLELPERAGPLLLMYFVAGIVAMPLWLLLSRRIGKHRAWCCAMVWASLAFMWAPLLGPGDFWPFFAVCVLSGLALGADLALPPAIQADVVDLDWLASGRRRTGLFFALWSMATKLSLAVAVGIAFPLLDLLGFTADRTSPAHALLGLAVLYGLVPVLIKITAIACVWNFPLDVRTHDATRRRLDQRAMETRTDESGSL